MPLIIKFQVSSFKLTRSYPISISRLHIKSAILPCHCGLPQIVLP